MLHKNTLLPPYFFFFFFVVHFLLHYHIDNLAHQATFSIISVTAHIIQLEDLIYNLMKKVL